jgi:2-dehydro-3-deoxygalactonokinase
MNDLHILKRISIPVGVRNSAIDGHNRALFEGLARAIAEIKNSIPHSQFPQLAVAAGMITSNLGICEVKHVSAPTGIEGLSSGIEVRSFPEFGQIPFYFIPGVRSGPMRADLDNADEIDIMRGEETEVIGYLSDSGKLGPLLYVHLGSHTKFIRIDDSNRIAGGLSTLAGELNAAVHKGTILHDSLPVDANFEIKEEFLLPGWISCRKFGLNRSLYLVRILHLHSEYSKESLGSFLLGAILSEDFRCLDSLRARYSIKEVVLSGLPHLQPAWSFFLKLSNISYRMLNAEETEGLFLRGAFRVLSLRLGY